MATKAKTKSTQAKKNKTPASIVWFEIPADDLSRAKKFYKGLLGWEINAFPGMKDYWHIDTGGPDATPDGGLMKRVCPEHQGITTYVHVESVDKSAAKVEKLGGKICKPKTAVPEMGYFAICVDTENNVFALWERNAKATAAEALTN
jgi:predicted enzyme related to lactoylglutathione lyase